jgi:hypothetical protein
VRGVYLSESLEEKVLFVVRDSDAGVPHTKFNLNLVDWGLKCGKREYN